MSIARLIYGCTQPTVHPLRRVTVYYFVLFGLMIGLSYVAPDWFDRVSAGPASVLRLEADGAGLSSLERTPGPRLQTPEISALIFSLAGALLLMMPISWGYMSARIRTGFDQSVVQTMLILPIAVAGIVMVVHDSIALAFSLAGIVAAVRFRNSLNDTADALYIFAAIGVGLACGVGAVDLAAVVSVFFNYVVLALWHCDYGVCPVGGPKEAFSSGHLLDRVGAPMIVAGPSGKGKKGSKKGRKKKKRLTVPAGFEVPAVSAPAADTADPAVVSEPATEKTPS
jgi:hypothetical protein